ncbi:MAG: YhbY family RNA-binding protein [Candidatus Thalassarchaeaceae archaeon]|jgi:RNA-binding protein|nr:YhbY family RNA-binding protein [Candidatus Thalassarchaeaceae archaeon]|tara:strand:- start:1967 stop:2236 length:270 start_codon:yes stop_codon:yes gene_type:complete
MNVPNSIKRKALDNSLEITIRVGKQGVNESVIDELKQQLLKRKLVKMKLNQGIASNNRERKLLFESVSNESESYLVLQRGNIAVFWSGE